MLYTFDLTLAQLNRVQDRVYAAKDPQFRIIHVLSDDTNHREDHYICLVSCSPETALLLYLL